MKFKFGDYVIVNSGFYKGVCGTIIDYETRGFEHVIYEIDGEKFDDNNCLRQIRCNVDGLYLEKYRR